VQRQNHNYNFSGSVTSTVTLPNITEMSSCLFGRILFSEGSTESRIVRQGNPQNKFGPSGY